MGVEQYKTGKGFLSVVFFFPLLYLQHLEQGMTHNNKYSILVE